MWKLACLAYALAMLTALPASAVELKVLSTGAPQEGIKELVPGFERRTGDKLSMTFMPVGPLLKAVLEGAASDIVVTTAETVQQLKNAGLIDAASITDVGSVGVGVAIKADAANIDISTPDAFKAAMLKAKSVVHMDPERGTSGKHMAEVFQRLGIADAMKAKTTLGSGGYIVKPVGTGEIEIGLQQITEILPVQGVRLLGPLPPALQKITIYQGMVTTRAQNPAQARAFLAYLREPASREAFKRKGFIE